MLQPTVSDDKEIDVKAAAGKLAAIRSKIDQLPPELKQDLFLECSILEDYMKDKYTRSAKRRKQMRGKKIGTSDTV